MCINVYLEYKVPALESGSICLRPGVHTVQVLQGRVLGGWCEVVERTSGGRFGWGQKQHVKGGWQAGVLIWPYGKLTFECQKIAKNLTFKTKIVNNFYFFFKKIAITTSSSMKKN